MKKIKDSIEILESAPSPKKMEKKHNLVMKTTLADKEYNVVSFDYVKNNPHHNFEMMVNMKEYQGNTLLLYAENVHDMIDALMNGNIDRGGGSACLRPFLYPHGVSSNVFAMGIVTGYSRAAGGFKTKTSYVEAMIRLNFLMIHSIIRIHDIRRVIFSCRSDNVFKFGSSIFQPCKDVVDYISDNICDIFTGPILEEKLDSKNEMKKFKEVKSAFVEHFKFVSSVVNLLARVLPHINEEKASANLVKIKKDGKYALSTGDFV